tara:strand:- start:227 stop:463 length:237 start_codon:yes stop_codon:yes gene_type:complete
MNNDNKKLTELLKGDLDLMQAEIERLTIENGLLRAASKEQRELNGALRVELNQLNEENMGMDSTPSSKLPYLPCRDVL